VKVPGDPGADVGCQMSDAVMSGHAPEAALRSGHESLACGRDQLQRDRCVPGASQQQGQPIRTGSVGALDAGSDRHAGLLDQTSLAVGSIDAQ